ncbi:MAG TPA: 4Fe-4S dicluster domain-containing protein, partial [Pengzhenrongella sp.]
DLPVGWTDEQERATYRLHRRADDAVFGFAAGAQSAKPVLFPAEELLWRSRRRGGEVPEIDTTWRPEDDPPVALLGVRSCDLAAIRIHDQVLLNRQAADVHYAARRGETFVVAVACTDPAGTCFCVSMGTGPGPGPGYDLSLTELYADGPHRFVVTAGSPQGDDVLAEVAAQPGAAVAGEDDKAAAGRAIATAEGRMGRALATEGLRELLDTKVESAHWDDVAARCLTCTNCTLVCPTCFCTSVVDVTDLSGDLAERHRVWDSCFSREYSYIHGGSVRESSRSRYRQWISHKLGSWQDQFGSSGCVGCGRCITWCPAGIDITAEISALRGEAHDPDRPARSETT